MDSLFKGPQTPLDTLSDGEPQAAAQSEDDAVAAALDQLRAAERSAGGELPTLITSRLAQIDDLLRIVIRTVRAQGASTEQRVLLEAIIQDYIPTPLRAYLSFPHDDRGDASPATLQFSTQLGILEETIHDMLGQIRIGAVAELSTHGRFLADKFAAPTLTLDGRP